MSKRLSKLSENKKPQREKSQPAKMGHTQTASGVKTDNLHVLAKTSAFVVNWPSGLVVQRPSGLAAKRHTTPQRSIQIPVPPRRATEKALGY